MDAKRLSATKAMLKKRASVDRSAPLVDDAAHPGSAGVLRAISAGNFELREAETCDASSPMLESGTSFQTDIRPAVFAEIGKNPTSSLKPTPVVNDRSEPVIEKWIHVDTSGKTTRKSLVDELKEKRNSIEALQSYNEKKTKEEIEKFTRPELMGELKSYKGFIEEKNEYNARNSISELAKNVNAGLVKEINEKRASISEFTSYAAAQQSEDNFRAHAKPALVNEIKMKRPSIDALTNLHRQNSAAVDVA